MLQNCFDIAIIGGGISGLMAAYRLSTEQPSLRIALFEQGNHLRHRYCPIVQKKTPACIKCEPCAIMEGLAGAGAYSDGKYVISTEYGGWLTQFLSDETVLRYIEQADDILVRFGATTERYMPSPVLKKKCLEHDLHMSLAQLKHLGTDANFETMLHLVEDLELRVSILTGAKVIDVDKDTHTLTVLTDGQTKTYTAQKVIFAVGRAGSLFFADWCRKNNVPLSNNQVDVGVRVELPAIIWEDFARQIYEPKIRYRTKQYGDIIRMFCFNDRGSVVTENTSGVLTVNGHSYREESRKTQNTNFALLSTTNFTQPFKEPIEYARHVASLANLISGGSVLVQRLGDLQLGRRTDDKRLRQGTVQPSLSAVPGDLSLCIPKRQLDNILEMLSVLDKIAPGTANYDTLLYGIECKYYSARPQCTQFQLNGCPGFYATGDGAGFTRSLSQAAANGLYVADVLLGRHNIEHPTP